MNGIDILLAKRIFTMVDQEKFCAFSGDYNPIHINEASARRSLAGQCIVHGIHSLLWALNELAVQERFKASIINAKFKTPVFLNEEVSCFWNVGKMLITIRAGNKVLVQAKMGRSEDNSKSGNLTIYPMKDTNPAEPTFAECTEMKDRPFILAGDIVLGRSMFPGVSEFYGKLALAELGALSRIVGMECPGLNSLFSTLSTTFKNIATAPVFGVNNFNENFRLLEIGVRGNSLNGKIEAFYRPSPVMGITASELTRVVSAGEFESISALVIGGSRGLGALVAKLLTSGGGRVTITYFHGEVEARQLQQEISELGGNIEILGFDAANSPLNSFNGRNFNQVYYFASPRIVESRSDAFNANIEDSYRNIYLEGFSKLVKHFTRENQECAFFYPSTIFAENCPIGFEAYAEIKKEGEALCQALSKETGRTILCPRLPRLLTDQNLSVVPMEFEDSTETLLKLVRELSENT